MGMIISGTIIGATKDLLTKDVSYIVNLDMSPVSWLRQVTMKEENLYSFLKRITKEHKDEIAYNTLMAKLDQINEAIENLVAKYAEPLKTDGILTFATIDGNVSRSIMVEGIGDITKEFNKLKKEVASIKKKIKTPSKKPVKQKEDK